MKPLFLLAAALLPLSLLAQTPAVPQAEAAMPAHADGHVLLAPSAMQWGDAPPFLEPGVQLAVLSGDPGKSGWFVLRLKAPAGYTIALHWHPTDEHVTLIEGDVSLQMGDVTGKNVHDFTQGSYVLLPARMHHLATTRGGAVLQVEGMGPFEINYIDPKDDPRLREGGGEAEG